MTRWHLSKPVTLSPIFGGGKGWEQDELYDIYQFFNRASTCRIFKIYSTGTSGLVLIRVQMKMFHLLTLANGIRVGLRGWGDVPTPSPLKGSWIFLQGKTESRFQQAGSKKNQISDFQTTNIISWSYPIQFWILWVYTLCPTMLFTGGSHQVTYPTWRPFRDPVSSQTGVVINQNPWPPVSCRCAGNPKANPSPLGTNNSHQLQGLRPLGDLFWILMVWKMVRFDCTRRKEGVGWVELIFFVLNMLPFCEVVRTRELFLLFFFPGSWWKMIWEELGLQMMIEKGRWNNFKSRYFGTMTFGCDMCCYWWWWWWWRWWRCWCWQVYVAFDVDMIRCVFPFGWALEAFGSASLSYLFLMCNSKTQSWNAACWDVMLSPSCFQCSVRFTCVYRAGIEL